MSREEAIEIFKRLKENAPNEMHLETVGTAQELFDMAIQALSQEPCDDAISRDAVLKLKHHKPEYGDMIYAFDVEQLPPVTQKSGKWINDENHIPICNKCSYIPPYDRAIDDYEYSNYCPNCGAKMVEPQESEDNEE